MPKLKNVVTGVVKDLPERYVGLYPYALVEDVVVEGYKSPASDGDGDGMIQDGTPFERPVGTELTEEEQVAAVKKSAKKSK
jgi:hypothetical protein